MTKMNSRTQTVDRNTQDEEINKYSVIDSSQLSFTDNHENKFTLPPDPIRCRSELISQGARPKTYYIFDEQIERLNDHIFKSCYLASIQAAELKELEESLERQAELEADLNTLTDEIGSDYELHLKPGLFPEEL